MAEKHVCDVSFVEILHLFYSLILQYFMEMLLVVSFDVADVRLSLLSVVYQVCASL